MTNKEKILKNATYLFAHRGFEALAVQEIASKSGVAVGTVFYHFTSKENLLLAVLEQTRKRIEEKFTVYFEHKEFASGLEMVEETVSFSLYVSELLEDEFLLLQRREMYEFAEKNPHLFRENLGLIYYYFVEYFERAIKKGQADGSIRKDLNSKKSALILHTMVDGLVRFTGYNLYDAGSLFDELQRSCRRMLQA